MKLDTIRFKSNWKKHLKELNISYIETKTDFLNIYNSNDTILTSRCSKTKTGKNKALPKDFYVSKLNKKFYEYVDNKYYYGILSDKYGIHFCDEKLDYYDVHPSELNDYYFNKLGLIIRNKCKKKGFSKIIFYNTSPLLSIPYLKMLLASGLKIYFITKIENIK